MTSGKEFDYIEEWGEAYEGKATSNVFLIDFANSENPISTLFEDKDTTFGQPCWAPSNEYVAFVGWPVSPQRLGLKYCYNRK